MGKTPGKIQWRISVPIYKNTAIWRQLGLAVGVPFGLVTLVIALSSGKSAYALYGLGLIAVLLFFIWIYIMAVYQGAYEAEFILDHHKGKYNPSIRSPIQGDFG